MSLAGERLRRRRDVLRRKIVGRAHDAAGARIVRIVDPQETGQPQVGDLGLAVGRDQQVAGLHVAMDQAAAVRMGQPAGRLRDDRGGVLHRQLAASPHELSQIGAGHEFGHQEIHVAIVPGVESAHQVLVIELGLGANLAGEAGDGIGRRAMPRQAP